MPSQASAGTMTRALRLTPVLLVIGLVMLAGCGSGDTAKVAGSVTPTAATTTQSTVQSSTTASSSYPVVQWANPPWPLSLQIVSITKNPAGFEGLGNAPPKWDWLMVRVAITNETADRGPPTPSPKILCSGPGSSSWNPGDDHSETDMLDGYEQEPGSTHLSLPADTSLAYGHPEIWASEWEVPEDTDTTKVSCKLKENEEEVQLN